MVYIILIGVFLMGGLAYVAIKEDKDKNKNNAMEFAEWCNSNDYYYLADHLWAKNNAASYESPTITTENLYKRYENYLTRYPL